MDASIPEETVTFAKKIFFLKLTFQDEGHLYAYCLLYILTIYYECLLFQFSGYDICMHIPILTKEVQKRTHYQLKRLS